MPSHYEILGSGPVLGYSHGNLFSPRVEDAIGILDWTPVARRRTVVRHHQRGHGRSPGEPDPARYTWAALAGDLLDLADRVAGLSDSPAVPAGSAGPAGSAVPAVPAGSAGPDGGSATVDWAGSSMGAAALLWAATARPERFRRLILMSPPVVREARAQQARGYRHGAATVERDGKEAWIRALRRFPKPPIFADVPTWQFDADVPADLLPSVLRGAAASDLPDDAVLHAITHPVLTLAWEGDRGHPVATAELLAGVLPAARLHVSASVDDIRTWPARIATFLDE
ncbi:alpha/beta fold hydrolase [Actinoplanes sp. DH11]|uniref:alpha/beta fold hydrolase n=1 Tax=Actinoplanes sp. DH11 TaxID=2857011 RepID=UPI001E340014|nr:alpha/beta hydrolase [Actinoplanes sp. DH11]